VKTFPGDKVTVLLQQNVAEPVAGDLRTPFDSSHRAKSRTPMSRTPDTFSIGMGRFNVIDAARSASWRGVANSGKKPF